MTSFLDLEDVAVSRLSNDDTPVVELTHATIRKDKIVLVLIDMESHEAPAQRRMKHAQKVGRGAYVAIDGFEISGTAHLALHSTADKTTFSADLKTFFPLTDAVVSFADSDRSTVRAGVALVNKDHLALFHLARPG